MPRVRFHKSAIVKQHDEQDCGPACLCSICRHHGVNISIARVRELAGTNANGTSLYGIVRAANSLGLKATALSGERKDLETSCLENSVQLPFIALIATPLGMAHFVVVYGITPHHCFIIDPAQGKRRLPIATFFSQWLGVIAAFEGTPSAQEDENPISLLRFSSSLIKNNLGYLIITISISLALTLSSIASAFLFQYLIDDIVMNFTSWNRDQLLGDLASACGLVALLYLIQACLTSIRARAASKLSNKLDFEIISQSFSRLICLPVHFFTLYKSGEVLSRFADTAKIRDAISLVAMSVFVNALMLIIGSFVLIRLSWQLALISFILFLAYTFTALLFSNRFSRANHYLMENNAQLQSRLKENIDGIEALKTFGQENQAQEKLLNALEDVLEQSFRLSMLSANQNVIVNTLFSIATVGIVWVGALEISNGELTLGTLIAFNSLVGYFIEPVQQLVGLQPAVQAAIVAFRRLSDILNAAPEDLSPSLTTLNEYSPISFSDVWFRYGAEDFALKNINLEVAPGEKLAITGESGSGKTTLARMIPSLYIPEKGTIKFGDHPQSTLNRASIREQIGYLAQEPSLFSGTIRENLTFGDPRFSDEEIAKVCNACELTQFLNAMPQGLDTVLSEKGSNLSGGQRQRIALARALLRSPQILVLDEATSNLDCATEKSIVEMLLSLKETTVIMVSHRLSAITSCNRIVHLEHGQISETGSHADLLKAKGGYYRLWRAQTPSPV